ncbi:S-adenosyl-L-methionine-dependent methyltransferase [Polychaeton citri CBS 116435]|uniref:DNA (cytosine-5-)-methyltransferase n=1 Tax=Polychaeton citri CBS 116435 TaxID=1314669 RepID=A0A9P4QCF3_9PEZI|nr:S-adenosyl-L-methionine-dependent methyltransferase [Polychaeton citri CBS 116435]
MKYRVGQTWEKDDGSFFKIARFVQGGDTALAQGTLFQRTRLFQGRLQKKRNEVCMVVMLDSEGKEVRSSIPLSSLYLPRELIITNTPFPGFSWRGQACLWQDEKDILERGVLVCRWKSIEQLDAAGKKVMRQGFVHITEKEADPGKSASDVRRLQDWCNRFASSTPDVRSDQPGKLDEAPVDLVSDDEGVEKGSEAVSTASVCQKTYKRQTVSVIQNRFIAKPRDLEVSGMFCTAPPHPQQDRSPLTVYTCGDICSGAGGMASGGVAAGLRYKFMLDNWDIPCRTLKLNFDSRIKVLRKDVFGFIDMAKRYPGRYIVTVLHLSLPCQYYALCHTVPGKNDETNIATNLCISETLDCCRPRIVTLEQTPGILYRDGGVWLNVMIRQFTDCAYSVHWRVLNMAEYGNPQARKRLIVIAAAPGEDLPGFPSPTHGVGPLLRPFVTISAALRKLILPMYRGMERYTDKNAAPYNPNTPLKSCITCSGGDSDLHYNGKRSFSLAELALLQSFPPTHRFEGSKTDIRKQIGNAVPSCFSRTLYKSLIESLKRSDKKRQGLSVEDKIPLIE